LNASDGNKTELSNLVLFFKDGKISGSGNYGSGSNYNEGKSTSWSGKYNSEDKSVEWIEVYGGNKETPFIYQGFRSEDKLWGTYRWTANQAVGTFEFTLSPSPSPSPSSLSSSPSEGEEKKEEKEGSSAEPWWRSTND